MVYNPTEISRQISDCTQFDELISLLAKIDGIQGNHRFYSGTELVELAAIVYEGVMPSVLTRKCGLRKKAMELSGKYSDHMIEFFSRPD